MGINMNIVIVGAGKVGYAIAKGLAKERHDITVIDSVPGKLNDITNTMDVISICGNGASYDVLNEAGAGNADLLIAVSGADEVNLLCCITAKKLGAKHTIARVRNPEYDRHVVFLHEELGLSMSVNPEQAAADEISRILRLPSATKVEPFAGGGVELVEFRITPGCKLDGLEISKLQAVCQAKVLVCAVERGNMIYIPKGDFTLKAEDRLNLVGTAREVYQFFDHVNGIKKRVRNVMILGGGKICLYLSRQLIDIGIKVKIIERNEAQCAVLKKSLPKATVILGDGTKPEVLDEEGVSSADAFVALTGFDENNIITSIYAGASGAGKLITKVNENHIIKMMRGRELDSFIQPKQLVSQLILRYVRSMQNAYDSSSVETLHHLLDGRIEALEFYVRYDSPITNRPLKSISVKPGMLVAAVKRGRKSFIPGGDDMILKGDYVVIISDHEGVQHLDDIINKQD
jgi:trk system potassium uptake protein TrkA